MIKANGIAITPTIFPDGTSQVWKLPKKLLKAPVLKLEWQFEAERELFDLFSLRQLLPSTAFRLYMDFIPYGRQDKPVSNESTFNLRTFATLLNYLNLSFVTAFDPHNPYACSLLIHNFCQTAPDKFHRRAIKKLKPDFIVFPDDGALSRYPWLEVHRHVVLEKERNQQTGEVKMLPIEWPEAVRGRGLIVDDICDGGATFILAARALRAVNPKVELFLAVSHGIFSKGREVLTQEGITIFDREKA